jgi:ureidoglycolate hydrolase
LVIKVEPIGGEAFAAYGEVLGTSPDGDRATVVEHWTAEARRRYGGEVKALSLSLPARAPELGFIEAHPNSPQLSVTFDGPWVLTVVPGIAPGSAVGRDADVTSARSFLVPPGTAVVLKAGLWHGPVTSLAATDALVIFREGVVDEWTELDNATPLSVPAAS